MKKQLLLLVMMLLPMMTMADAVEINGIYYNLSSDTKEAEVTSNPDKYKGYVNIPESVTYEDVKYNVKEFRECKEFKTIVLYFILSLGVQGVQDNSSVSCFL